MQTSTKQAVAALAASWLAALPAQGGFLSRMQQPTGAARVEPSENAEMPKQLFDWLRSEDNSDIAVVYLSGARFLVDDVLVGVSGARHLRLPLMPGRYLLTAEREQQRQVLPVELQAGRKYMYVMNAEPVGLVDRSSAAEYYEARFSPFNLSVLSNPRHAFLPSPHKESLQRCLESGDGNDCRVVQAAVPAPLLSYARRDIDAVLARSRKVEYAALLEGLPPEMRRDKYTLQLREALAARRFGVVPGLCESLYALGLPLEPEVRFFHGEALLENGDSLGALEKLYDYVTETGPSGTYYTRALELIARGEASL
ncbi:MAG: hypothetical protein ACO38Y_06625 [Steroidobacteraceae bacterium]